MMNGVKFLYRKQFEENRKVLDDHLKELYQLGDCDNLIPQIRMLYAAD